MASNDSIMTKARFRYFWTLLKALLAGKVDKEVGKGLSTNDYTTAEKQKLAGIDPNASSYELPTASVSTKGGIKIGAGLTMTGDVLSADTQQNVPTKTSDLTNDSGFITTETDPTVPDWAKSGVKPTYTASEVGAAEAGHTHSASDVTAGVFPAGRLPEMGPRTQTSTSLMWVYYEGAKGIPPAPISASYQKSTTSSAEAEEKYKKKVLTIGGWKNPYTTPTVTLTVAGWENNTQTVSLSSVSTVSVVIVSPAPASNDAYARAGVLCTTQSSGSLTFSCTTPPTDALTVNVLVL